jgi:hypothetical protein
MGDFLEPWNMTNTFITYVALSVYRLSPNQKSPGSIASQGSEFSASILF